MRVNCWVMNKADKSNPSVSRCMEMLEQAVNALKEGKEPSLDQLLRPYRYRTARTGTVTDDYIPDVEYASVHLQTYRQL